MSGCAPVQVENLVLRPGKEASIPKGSKIAVLKLDGDRSGSVSRRLETRLNSIEFSGEKYFTAVDRQSLQRVLDEQNLASGNLANASGKVTAGFLDVADYLVGGSTDFRSSRSGYRENRRECARRNEKKECVQYREFSVTCYRQEAYLDLILSVTSTQTARLILTKDYSNSTSHRYCPDKRGSAISDPAFSDALLKRALAAVRRDLAPYAVTITVKLMERPDDGLKDNEQASIAFKNGITSFKNDRTGRGCEEFRRALSSYSQSYVLLYNVAVCNEIEGNLDDALSFYKKADRLAPIEGKSVFGRESATGKIGDAISRVTRTKSDLRAARNQLQ